VEFKLETDNRSAYAVLKDIAKVWNDLSDVDKEKILKVLADK